MIVTLNLVILDEMKLKMFFFEDGGQAEVD
jgi:hypothetical protein